MLGYILLAIGTYLIGTEIYNERRGLHGRRDKKDSSRSSSDHPGVKIHPVTKPDRNGSVTKKKEGSNEVHNDVLPKKHISVTGGRVRNHSVSEPSSDTGAVDKTTGLKPKGDKAKVKQAKVKVKKILKKRGAKDG